MGKSAKEYRLERDAARQELGLEEGKQLQYHYGNLSEVDIKALIKQNADTTNSLVFKATDRLIKENRLVYAELSDDRYTLEFRL